MVQADGPIIRVHDLPDTVQTNHSLRPESAIPQPTLSLEEAEREAIIRAGWAHGGAIVDMATVLGIRSEEHTSELQSLTNLVCRLLLEKKKTTKKQQQNNG